VNRLEGFTPPTRLTRVVSIGNQIIKVSKDVWELKPGCQAAAQLGTTEVTIIGVTLSRNEDPPGVNFYVSPVDDRAEGEVIVAIVREKDFASSMSKPVPRGE
jgi:hypothetical protein